MKCSYHKDALPTDIVLEIDTPHIPQFSSVHRALARALSLRHWAL